MGRRADGQTGGWAVGRADGQGGRGRTSPLRSSRLVARSSTAGRRKPAAISWAHLKAQSSKPTLKAQRGRPEVTGRAILVCILPNLFPECFRCHASGGTGQGQRTLRPHSEGRADPDRRHHPGDMVAARKRISGGRPPDSGENSGVGRGRGLAPHARACGGVRFAGCGNEEGLTATPRAADAFGALVRSAREVA